LSVGLEQVQNFLRQSKDIIFWHTGGFNQEWTDEAHFELIEILKEAFSRWWVKPDERKLDCTLNEFWSIPDLPSNEGRIIVSYGVIVI
jgi:hypothetical protein